MKRLLIMVSMMLAILGMTLIGPFTTSASAQQQFGLHRTPQMSYRTKHKRHHRRHRRHIRRKGTVTIKHTHTISR